MLSLVGSGMRLWGEENPGGKSWGRWSLFFEGER